MTRGCFGVLRLAAVRPILLHACSATVRFLHSWAGLTISFLCLIVNGSTQLLILCGTHLLFVGSICLRRSTHVTHSSDVSFIHLIFLDQSILTGNVQQQPYVLTTNGCGNYHRVSCEAFFSKPSTLAQTFVPHQ